MEHIPQHEQEGPSLRGYIDERLLKSQSLTKDDIEQIHTEAIERFHRGEAVWMPRVFDDDKGRVYDFYAEQQHRGYVEEDYELGRHMGDVYAFSVLDKDAISLNEDPIAVEQGMLLLETFYYSHLQ